MSSSKPSSLKGVARVLIALLLVGGLLWFVSWSDRLTWPSRFGEKPLVGELTIEPGAGGRTLFRVAAGSETGTEIEFLGGAGDARWSSVVLRKPGAAAQTVALDEAERSALEKQPEAGLKTTGARLLRAPLALIEAVLLYVVGAMISFQRWQVLLRAIHVDAKFWRVQKLGFLGLFFSNIIPGMTGGDLVKAIMVARDHPEQRPEAVLSVIVDRAIGLLGLALVASGVLLFQHGRFDGMELKLNLILGAILLGACVVMSRRVRRAIRLDKLLGALPFAEVLKKLDRSALLYRDARWQLAYSVTVSLVVHGMILTAIGVLGRALGIEVRFVDYYALAPLALIAQSLPISPGGVGVGEFAFIVLFSKAGVPRAAALALAVSYRVVQLAVSLVGGILLLVRHERPVSDKEMEDDGDGSGG